MPNGPIVVCFPFVGDEIGGSHISAAKLIKALDPRLAKPLVVLHIADGPVADFLKERDIPFVVAPTGALPKRDGSPALTTGLGVLRHLAGVAWPLARFLRENGVGLVHTNDGRIHLAWALPARLAGARQVWHHRGDPDAKGVNLLAPLIAGHIVTVSHFSKPSKPIVNIDHKLSVVHSPFDQPPEGDRTAARAALIDTLKCPADTRFLGYFGLLIDRKRPLGFVEAVAAYIQRHPDLPVMGLIFGVPGSESPNLDRLTMQHAEKLGVADRIRLMGFRSPVDTWMQAMDILLVPAVREPFGRTLIEAMFLRTPVVATNDGGNSEAIEDGVNGFLVQADKPETFAEPIHRLLTDPFLTKRITETARAQALSNYGIERHVGRLTAIYRDLQRVEPQRAAVAIPSK
jgi:glycosyltransferase involved in cell wall biosynthesis